MFIIDTFYKNWVKPVYYWTCQTFNSVTLAMFVIKIYRALIDVIPHPWSAVCVFSILGGSCTCHLFNLLCKFWLNKKNLLINWFQMLVSAQSVICDHSLFFHAVTLVCWAKWLQWDWVIFIHADVLTCNTGKLEFRSWIWFYQHQMSIFLIWALFSCLHFKCRLN